MEKKTTRPLTVQLDSLHSISILLDSLSLYDYARNRAVPVALYLPDSAELKQKLIIFNHGYGENKGDAYLSYSYLNAFLAAKGYMVASVQHELPTDDPLPMTGNLRETRGANWERGVENMFFVLKELKIRNPNIDDRHIMIIGHSNGGDITMLFATEYPQKVVKAITLDNRRMPIPRVSQPRIYSLRSSDVPADEGVLPSPDEQQKYGITIVQLPDIKHVE
ncbi:MAG TPA: hypothetical protein VK750_00145, partial [Cytophagaceae bacterium]|nr:hypothetical protein [Cytophagaceae bacterium]